MKIKLHEIPGKSNVRGYNAPCFERMVHSFMGSVLMRWDNGDRKDTCVIPLNHTFSSGFDRLRPANAL